MPDDADPDRWCEVWFRFIPLTDPEAVPAGRRIARVLKCAKRNRLAATAYTLDGPPPGAVEVTEEESDHAD